MHPARDARLADYPGEAKSKYEIWQVLGWPYETSAAMARIVLSGMLDWLPEMKIITHHLGVMLPYFESGVGPLWDPRDNLRRRPPLVRLLGSSSSATGSY
jgi:hypothetical protein